MIRSQDCSAHRNPAIVFDCMVLTVNYTLLEAACKNKIKKMSKDRENIDSEGSGNYGLVKLEP